MSQILQLVFRVSSFWFLVNLIHILLTKLLGEKYNFYLSRNGIFIKFVQLQWHTKRFNSTIMEGFVRRYSSKIALWFTCGAYFGIIAMFSSIIILMYTFVVSFVKDTEDSSKILTPVVPGVNLPNSQIIPYHFNPPYLRNIPRVWSRSSGSQRGCVHVWGWFVYVPDIPSSFC